MNKRFPYNTSDLKPSRRDFLRLSGAGMAAAMMARYGMAPILAQGMGEISPPSCIRVARTTRVAGRRLCRRSPKACQR